MALACDSCRKQKCKCERDSPDSACRQCHLLGLQCTFLGPSRKRGPPKGYIDALEARLHQLEAIMGTLIATNDPRARTLVADLSIDPLARKVLERISESPFGPQGRQDASSRKQTHSGSPTIPDTGRPKKSAATSSKIAILPASETHQIDPYDWQSTLENIISTRAGSSSSRPEGELFFSTAKDPSRYPLPPITPDEAYTPPSTVPASPRRRSSNRLAPPVWSQAGTSGSQRRRLDSGYAPSEMHEPADGTWSSPLSSSSSNSLVHPKQEESDGYDLHSTHIPYSRRASHGSIQPRPHPLATQQSFTSLSDHAQPPDDKPPDDVTETLGQLSIDDQDNVRYHGQASGLHLLASVDERQSINESRDSTPQSASSPTNSSPRRDVNQSGQRSSESGLWNFPPSGVWPPTDSQSQSTPSPSPPGMSTVYQIATSRHYSPLEARQSPGFARQKALWGVGGDSGIELPPKEEQKELLRLYFLHVHPVIPVVHKSSFWKSYHAQNCTDSGTNGSVANSKYKPVPTALLLAMFAVASRYTKTDSSSYTPGQMWTAGVGYSDLFRETVFRSKIPSRLSTVQALLLVGYMDVGVGFMASAWYTIGLAVRSALDIGLNRSIDKWPMAGTSLFSDEEKETCRRTWYMTIMMDNYLAAYLGRPSTFRPSDYDTPLPESDSEDQELWVPPSSPASSALKNYQPSPVYIIACFTARAKLSVILGHIMNTLYSLRPSPHRDEEASQLESELDKWYLGLPEYLRYDSPGRSPIPASHIATLHMNYWTVVLLLHRPSIRAHTVASPRQENQKAYGLCRNAANKLAAIGAAYAETYQMRLAPGFLSYYLFTASIMHCMILLDTPEDIQAVHGLEQCMNALKGMEIVWPSAGRAWDILNSTKKKLKHVEMMRLEQYSDRSKRSAEEEAVRSRPSRPEDEPMPSQQRGIYYHDVRSHSLPSREGPQQLLPAAPLTTGPSSRNPSPYSQAYYPEEHPSTQVYRSPPRPSSVMLHDRAQSATMRVPSLPTLELPDADWQPTSASSGLSYNTSSHRSSSDPFATAGPSAMDSRSTHYSTHRPVDHQLSAAGSSHHLLHQQQQQFHPDDSHYATPYTQTSMEYYTHDSIPMSASLSGEGQSDSDSASYYPQPITAPSNVPMSMSLPYSVSAPDFSSLSASLYDVPISSPRYQHSTPDPLASYDHRQQQPLPAEYGHQVHYAPPSHLRSVSSFDNGSSMYSQRGR